MKCIKTFTTSWIISDEVDLDSSPVLIFDLQLFNQEKTEDATPKKKEEARKKGQVAKSAEINSAFVILAAFLGLKVVGPYIYSVLTGYMQFMFGPFTTSDFTIDSVQHLSMEFAIVFLKTALPVMFIILIISMAINFLQVGFMFTLEPLMPKLDRLNPIAGFSRLFALRSIVELVKSLFKIALISYFIYRFISREAPKLPELFRADINATMQYSAALIFDLAIQIGAIILVLGALDYFYQWWEHNKSLKMSKQEIKEEFKQTEGNPLIKGKIKERQRAIAMRRMMQEVPKATAIVTNPTHFAVAIKYEKHMSAPEVVAKGQDFLAERIKTIARENRVTIVENKPLARALYAMVEVGDAIPAELYQAVAEVLAYVFRLKKRLS